MPSLDEVLNHFPNRSFLIHIKSNNPYAGEVLAKYLKNMHVIYGAGHIVLLRE